MVYLYGDDEQLETNTFPFHEEITLPPEDGQDFQFQEEHLQNISLEDETRFLTKRDSILYIWTATAY